jgi:hypothetical protein
MTPIDRLAALRSRVATLIAERDAARAAALEARPGSDDAGVARRRAAELDRRILLELGDAIGDGPLATDAMAVESQVPLALLPVRLETRFGDDGTTLRIRVYPDEIHVQTEPVELSATERTAGERYWRTTWRGTHARADAEAWVGLVAAVGAAARARFLVEALRPMNPGDRPTSPVPGDLPLPKEPAFPATRTRADGQRPPPLARLLPDRWCALAYHAGRRTQAWSGPIADDVVAGMDLGGELTRAGGDVTTPESRWLTDWDTAVEVGMAFTMRFGAPVTRIDRLLVFGVRATLSPDAAAARLATLLASHQIAPGVAFVRQGTPTNNTATERTPWTARPDLSPPAATATTPATVAADTNAATVARALGVDAALLAGVPHGQETEPADARAMATALWEPTWGAFLQKLTKGYGLEAALTPDEVDAARTYFVAHVRGRGPLPAIRVGRQPYGILPAFSLDRWQEAGRDPTRRWLPGFLRLVRDVWRASLGRVPRLVDGPPGAAFDDLLLDVLAMTPTCRDVRVRSVVAEKFCRTIPAVLTEDRASCEAERRLNEYVFGLFGLATTKLGDNGSVQKDTRRLGLPFVLPDPAGGESLDRAYLRAQADEASAARPDSLLAILVEDACALERARREALRTHAAPSLAYVPDATVRVDVARITATPPAADSARAISARMTELRASAPLTGADPVALILGGRPDRLDPVALRTAPAALAVVHGWVQAEQRFAEFKDALRQLAGLPADRLELLLAEMLDLASHRLDAWLTAFATRRLHEMRAAEDGAQGVMVGAYGWVEDLVATPPQPAGQEDADGTPLLAAPTPGGYVHAPSVAHATTAAILRGGHLAHVALDPSSRAVAIDLSSRRVRLAVALLEGVRQGQPLGALLGYRLERWLHEGARTGVELDRFIAPLRAMAPLVANKLRADLQDPGVTAESVAASNVVDGLRLLEQTDDAIVAALPAMAVPSPTPEQASALRAILGQLRGAADAVADVLLAEAVHQLALGNTERAAAALDAAGAGEAPPPEPDVVRTPAAGTAVTYRVVTVASSTAVGAGGWSDASPRARAEPRLEAWTRALLGPADRVLVAEPSATAPAITAADVGLAALDLVYGVDAGLERWLARRIGPERVLVRARSAATPGDAVTLDEALEVARLLRDVVSGARPLGPETMTATGTPLTAQPNTAELTTRRTALRAVASERADEAEAAAAARRPRTRLVGALRDLSELGIAGPESLDLDAFGLAEELLRMAGTARARIGESDRLIAAAADAAAQPVEVSDADGLTRRAADVAARLAASIEALFGGSVRVLPLVTLAADPAAGGLPAPEAGATAQAATETREGIRAWLEAMAGLRAPVARLSDLCLACDAIGTARPSALDAVQLLSGPGATGAADRWVAPPFHPSVPAPDGPSPRGPVTVLVRHAPAGVAYPGAVAGLVVDEWVETIPRRVSRERAGVPTLEVPATTALAVNANAPNARPPHAILLAVTPGDEPWSTAALEATLLETLELAKIRAVTLETVIWAGRLLPALYFADYALQGVSTAMFSRYVAGAGVARFVEG